MSQVCFIVLLFLYLAIRGLGIPTYDVIRYGAIGNGKRDDAKAFSHAWNAACSDPNSPILLIPQGKLFLLGLISFQGPCKSRVHVQIDGKISAPGHLWKGQHMDHWIGFKDIEGLTIDGKGQIDGQGPVWWPCKHRKKGCPQVPDSLGIIKCNDVELSGLKFINSPAKHITVYKCVMVYISGLTITAPGESPNTDGIHIGKSQQVVITNSTIGTGDDCIAIGSNSININISHINCGPGHGISIGSLGKDRSVVEVEQIHVHNCHLYKTTNGIRIKTWEGGFGYASGITFENINFTAVKRPIIIDQHYCSFDKCPPRTSSVHISDVKYIGAIGSTHDNVAISLACSENFPCTEIFMQNIDIRSERPGVKPLAYCFNVEGTKKDPVRPNVPCLN